MSTVTTKDGIEIYYKDWGPKDAQPIVFHHGWPLSAQTTGTTKCFTSSAKAIVSSLMTVAVTVARPR